MLKRARDQRPGFVPFLTPLILLLFFAAVPAVPAFGGEGKAGPSARLLPPETLLYLSVDDYNLFKKYAESMPIAKILQEEEVREFLKKPSAYLKKNLDELRKMVAVHDEKMAAQMDRWLSIEAGRFFMALTHVTPPSPSMEGGPSFPDIGLAAGFSLEGGEDAAALVKGVLDTLGRNAGVQLSFEDEDVQGITCTRVICPEGPQMPAYTFTLGDLYVFTLSRRTMETMVNLYKNGGAGSLAESPSYKDLAGTITLPEAGSGDAYANIQGITDLLATGVKVFVSMSGDAETAGKVDAVMDRLGFNTMGGTLARCLSRDGVARSEGVVAYRGRPKGMPALFPMEPIDKAELKLVPKDVQSCSLFRFDLPGLYDLVMDVIRTVDEDTYQEVQGGIKGFCMALSQGKEGEPLDLRRDLFGLFGTRMILYQSGGAGSPMGMMMPSMCFLVEIKDFDRFVSTMKTMVEGAAAMNPELKDQLKFTSVNYKDHRIHYLQITQAPMVTPSFAEVGGFLAFALQIDDVKRMIRRASEGGESILDNEDFTACMKKLPEGVPLVSLSYTRTADLFGQMYGSLGMMVPMLAMAMGSEVELPFDLQLLPTAECITKHLFSSFKAGLLLPDGKMKTVSYGPMGMEVMRYLFPVAAMAGFMVKDYLTVQQVSSAPPEAVEPQPVDEEAFKANKARVDLASLFTGCLVYKLEYKKYPETLDELLKKNENYPKGFLNKAELPLDPWGHPYLYKKDGPDYEVMIYSTGPNGRDEGGAGDDLVKKQ